MNSLDTLIREKVEICNEYRGINRKFCKYANRYGDVDCHYVNKNLECMRSFGSPEVVVSLINRRI